MLMIMPKALHPRDDIDFICQEGKEEEDSPALTIASMYQHKYLGIILKRAKKD